MLPLVDHLIACRWKKPHTNTHKHTQTHITNDTERIAADPNCVIGPIAPSKSPFAMHPLYIHIVTDSRSSQGVAASQRVRTARAS